MSSETGTSNNPRAFRDQRGRSWRQLWLDIHLYLGLFAGALLVIFGITGSILVFWQEIDEWLNPDLLTVTVPKQADGADGEVIFQSLHKIVHAAEQAASQDSKITALYGPRAIVQVYLLWL